VAEKQVKTSMGSTPVQGADLNSSQDAKPLVSVIIPTYNRQRLVQETIDSVFSQTFTNWELIVVDDGSTDDTRQALTRRYGNRIRYEYQDNRGESSARNRGISLSQGGYVAFLDSDDLWLPTKLERQVALMEAMPDVGLVSTQAWSINYEGLRLQRPPQGHGRVENTIRWEELVLGNAVAGGGSTAMVRREFLVNANGFDAEIRFGEEWDLWLRIAPSTRLYQIPEPLCCYRINPFGARGWVPRAEEANQVHIDHLKILNRAFHAAHTDCPEVKALEGQALSRAYLRHALVCYGLGRVELGFQHWQTAIGFCPGYAADLALIRQRIVNLVAAMVLTPEAGGCLSEGKPILERILSRLPKPVSALGQQRRTLWAAILAELAHLAAQNKKTAFARQCAALCLATDREWVRNRGLLKILLTGGRHLWPEPVDCKLPR
jgi:glycosyltransferase involved in cell wall biosynthesis